MALLPALLVALVAGAFGGEGDATVLVQRSLRSSVAAGWRHRLSQREFSFRVGDHLHFRLFGTKWLNCTVVGRGEKPDTYTIHVSALPLGHQRVEDVAAWALRDPRKERARAAARKEAERRAAAIEQWKEAQAEVQYEDQEIVLIAGTNSNNGSWFNGRIMGGGTIPGSYNVQYQDMLIPNVAPRHLRKAYDVHFKACENVEVKGGSGTRLPAKVLGPGSDVGLVNIRMAGHVEFQDIPVAVLRRVKPDVNASDSGGPKASKPAGASDAGSALEATLASLGPPTLEGLGSSSTADRSEETAGQPVFKVGTAKWVQLESGRESKPWVPATITGSGDEPGTYNLHVTVEVPAYDLCDVPVHRLRETNEDIQEHAREEARRVMEAEERRRAAEEVQREEAEEAERRRAGEEQARREAAELEQILARQAAVVEVLRAANYRVGQTLQFNPFGSRWVNSTIVSLGYRPQTYNIHVHSFPEDLREIYDVHEKALRTFEDAAQQRAQAAEVARKAAEEAKARAKWLHAFEPEERVQVRAKGQSGAWVDAIVKTKDPSRSDWYTVEVGGQKVELHTSALRRDMDHEFDPEEAVEILGNKSTHTWMPCTIVRRGTLPNTYDVRFPRGPVGHRDIYGIDSRALRRVKFHLGSLVEVLIDNGPNAGLWLQANVTGRAANKPDTYSVRIQDPPLEYNLAAVPYKRLRVSEVQVALARKRIREEEEAKELERRRKAREEAEQAAWEKEHTFEDGELVQVLGAGKAAGKWINVTVVSKGSKNLTYILLWRNGILFKDVKREKIRKDPESEAARARKAAEVMRRLEAEEAARHAALKEAQAEEEAQRRLEEAAREEVSRSEGSKVAASAAPAEEEVEKVSKEELERLVKEAETMNKLAEERRQQQKREEMDDLERRQAEWVEALAADEASSKPPDPSTTPALSLGQDVERQAPENLRMEAEEAKTLPDWQGARLEATAANEPQVRSVAQSGVLAPSAVKDAGRQVPENPQVEVDEAQAMGAEGQGGQAARPALDEETARQQAEWEAMLAREDKLAGEDALAGEG